MENKNTANTHKDETIKRKYNNLEAESLENLFFGALNDGEVKKEQQLKLEYKRFDENWLTNIEIFLPSLLKITQDLRSSLKYEEEILPIEKTRRTNPESIRHLLRNTRYIKDVGKDGNVIPEKVLNTLSDIDYGIYENRFIMTLIDRLYHYLLSRIEVIKNNVIGSKELKFDYESDFELDNTTYLLHLKISSNEDIDTKDIDIHNYRLYELVNDAFKIVSRIYYGEFMQVMKKYQKVKPPILKTQIILKNPDFKNAYLLWLYLDRLNELDYTLEQKIKDIDIDKSYKDEIEKSLFAIFYAVYSNSDIDVSDENVKSINIKQKDIAVESYSSNLIIQNEPYVLEPNLATEYQLTKSKQLFGRGFHAIKREKNNEALSIKQALVDQYSIADQIFTNYFGIDQDKDVFSQLLTYKHPVKKYEEALKKYRISQIKREVNEKNFVEALKLESRWIKESEKLQGDALMYLMDRRTTEVDNEIEQMKKELKNEVRSFKANLKKNTKKSLQDQRRRNRQSLLNLKDKHKLNLKDFREKERERLAKERAKIKAQRKKRLERERLKQLEDKERELKKLRARRDKNKKALRERLALKKDELRTKNNQKIEDFKERNK